MVFLNSNMCSNERKCALHLRVPNELLQNMFIIECLRTWCAHADSILQGWLYTNGGNFFLMGCAHARGWLFTDRGDLTRPPSIYIYIHIYIYNVLYKQHDTWLHLNQGFAAHGISNRDKRRANSGFWRLSDNHSGKLQMAHIVIWTNT